MNADISGADGGGHYYVEKESNCRPWEKQNGRVITLVTTGHLLELKREWVKVRG